MKKALLIFIMLGILFETNAQKIVTFPYSENFESTNGGWYEGDDAPISQTGGVWHWGKPQGAITDTAASGNKAWFTTFSSYPEGFWGDPYIVSPVFDLSSMDKDLNLLEVSFNLALALEGETIGAFVGYRINGDDWQILGQNYWYNNWFEDYINAWSYTTHPWRQMKITLPLNQYMANVQFGIAFRHQSYDTPNTQLGVAFDDFTLKEVLKPKVSESDSLALVALYNATNGKKWSRNQNWLTGSVHKWHGIFTEDGKVKMIHLGYNNLTGALPKELFNLKDLEELSLVGNNIKGSLPAELGKLTSLRILYLTNNNFSGKLPKEIVNLGYLTEINLANNKFSGDLPKLTYFGYLELLDFSNNKFTGTIPFFDHYAYELNFDNNKFTAIAPPPYELYYTAYRFSNNKLTFEDLEPFFSKVRYFDSYTYIPQDAVGDTKGYILEAGSSIKISSADLSPGNRYQWYLNEVLLKDQISSSLELKNLSPGEYKVHYLITNTKVPDLTLTSRTINIRVKEVGEKVIYRVNAGGGYLINDTPLSWSTDTKVQPSSYLTTTKNTLTEGACWAPGLVNGTGAPNCIFGSLRVGWAEGLKYKFPVANGKYKVNLYFAAKIAPTSVPGKTFNVLIENEVKLKDFDIFATAGLEAIYRSFIVDITDGYINIDLTRAKGYAQINGIEISSIPVSEVKNTLSKREEPSIFPTSWNEGALTVQLNGYQNEAERIEITDKQGVVKYKEQLNKNSSLKEVLLSSDKVRLQQGLYFVRIYTRGYPAKVIRFIKE